MLKPLAYIFVFSAMSACVAPAYPSRPNPAAGSPITDAEPTKLNIHLTSTLDGLSALFEAAIPLEAEGTLDDDERDYFWKRGPIALRIVDGKIQAMADLDVGIEFPVVGKRSLSFGLTLRGEPIISSDYRALLQGAEIEIDPKSTAIRAANVFLGVIEIIKTQLQDTLDTYAYDLAPHVNSAFAEYAAPYALPLGDADGCLSMNITGIEAGPTVLAGGLEKDIAFTVSPGVTLPCTVDKIPGRAPPLANVASIPTGAFKIQVPVAAKYDELTKAMELAFTDGKLYISDEHPNLYVSEPEVYANDGNLVLKVHLAGKPSGAFSPKLDGDIYFSGKPQVIDNELTVPDIAPTVDTQNFLLKLAANLGSSKIRDAIRKALRLDIGARLQSVRRMTSKDFAFANGMGCLRTQVAKIAVTGVYPHAAYLRVYVDTSAQASVYVPCPDALEKIDGESQILAPADTHGSSGGMQ